MTVVIFKNNKYQRSFRKYFAGFAYNDIKTWTETHFVTAKKKEIELQTNTIYIRF